MSRIGIAVHRFREDALALAKNIANWGTEQGHQIVVLADDASRLGGAIEVVDSFANVDLLVTLGGDGTMLRAVQLLEGKPIPVVGVHVGLLGYLASVEHDHALDAVKAWCTGTQGTDFSYEDRMLLEVRVRDSETDHGRFLSLNEVVIEKIGPGHTVRLGVSINDASFTTYAADGLIIATPTGSTAYAMSVRGPILSPRLRAMLLTPVSPHMLFDRSLVLDPSEEIDVQVLGYRGVNIAIDGTPICELGEDGHVYVRPANEVVRLVNFEQRHFHQILKSKFGLSDR